MIGYDKSLSFVRTCLGIVMLLVVANLQTWSSSTKTIMGSKMASTTSPTDIKYALRYTLYEDGDKPTILKSTDKKTEKSGPSASHEDGWGDTHARHCQGNVKHIHLSVGKDPRKEMTISFASSWSDPPNVPMVAGVRWGTRPDALDYFTPQEDTALFYNTSYPEGSKYPDKIYHSPYQHHITIRNLEPGTTYHYIPVVTKRNVHNAIEHDLRQLSEKGWKRHPSHDLENYSKDSLGRPVYRHFQTAKGRRRLAPRPYNGFKKACPEKNHVRTFTTAPRLEKASEMRPFRFGILGDLGQFEHSERTLQHMLDNPDAMDAVMLVGDIAYTNEDHRRWDTFFDFLDDYPIFHSTPVQIATGNHDIEKSNDGRIFQSYENRFRMPQVRNAELGTFVHDGDLNMNDAPYPLPYDWGNAYYSFDYGPAKHISVSAYSSMEPSSTQYKWLVRELEALDREKTPWVLVSIHVPLYNTYKAHRQDLQVVAAQQHLEPLLVKYHVNAVFTGHVHAYQRIHPVAMGEVDPTGPWHVTVGASGRQCCLSPFHSETPEEWVAVRDGDHYGYGHFTIHNRTHAEWQWIPTSWPTMEDTDPLPLRDIYMLENQFYLKNKK